jgi:iron complex outermembrane receptor protein
MKLSFTSLAASVALAALSAGIAQAADPVAAAEPAPVAADAAAGEVGEVVVLGFGRGRQEQEITQQDIARITPGSSPLKAISKLPGVQFQAGDPFGAYEWAVRISLRGFNQNQLGFTLDDVPLGDMSYGNVNGLHISRAIIGDNIGRTVVAQGAGALGTASTSNLGGTMQFYSDAPRKELNVTGSVTGGADSTYRGYVRLDSGDLGGVRGYVSYAYLHTDKWKGNGPQYQHQANAKLVGDIGSIGTLSGFFNFSARRETDYQDMTLDLLKRVGWKGLYKIDNVSPNYNLAKQIGLAYQNGTAYPSPYTNPDDVYFDAGGLRNDYLAGTTLDIKLAPGLTFKATGYYHENKGQGSWVTPYQVTPAGAKDQSGSVISDPGPLSFRTTEYAIHRGGINGGVTWEAGINTLQVGGWYEANKFNQARRYYGLSNSSYNRDTLAFQKNPFATQYEGVYHTDTYQYFVEDNVKLLDDALVLSAGWKGVKVDNKSTVTVGSLASGTIGAKDMFQPQASIVYHITPTTEVFADYSENMRAFVSSLTTGPFSTTQAGFNALKSNLKPETSKTYEGGVRFHDGPFQASAVAYYIDFQNRLMAFANGSGIAGNPAILNNVGAVHAYGAELSAYYKLNRVFSLFANYSYNHSKYQNDVMTACTTGGVAGRCVLARTKGKTVVDAPENMIKGEIVYDDGAIFGRVGGDYMSKRYFSYENNLVAAGRAVVDASIGYRFNLGGFFNNVSIEASVTNLTDKKYISTVNTNNVQINGNDFDNPNFMLGAPRQWFITLKKGF